MFISIDASSGTARSVAAAGTIRAARRRLVRGRQMTGGKGAKGGNPPFPFFFFPPPPFFFFFFFSLYIYIFSGPYSGAQVLIEGLRKVH